MSFLKDWSPGGSHDPFDVQQTNPNSKFQKPNQPTPPDYQGLIDEQAKVNRINQNTPFGSLNFTTDKNGNTTANMQYDPQTNAYANQLGNVQANYINATHPYSPTQFNPQDNTHLVNHAVRQSYNEAMRLMQPQLQQQQEQLTQNMADRGLPIGSEIQANAQNQFNNSRNNLMNQAAYNAIGQGQSLENQLYNQELAANQQNNQFGLGSYQANLGGLGELSQLQQQLPGLKDFFSPTGIDVNGSAGLANQAAQQNYAQQMQAYGANMGGLYSMGGAGLAALFGG